MKRSKDNRGSTIVMSAMFVALFTVAVGSYMTVVSSGSLGTVEIGNAQRAFYCAEAGAHRLLQEINDFGATSFTGTVATETYAGTYQATSDNNEITSTGTVGNMSRTVVVGLAGALLNVKAAVTVNSSATTTGGVTVDGRDHDEDGNLTGDPGLPGISTPGTVTQTGSSEIGGSGQAPGNPAGPGAIEEFAQPFAGTEPWEILGVSQTWFQNNVPVQTTPPPGGYEGIYYYDPPGGLWQPADIGGFEGILIVHNPTNTATMKNLKGDFTGLIITDQISHINSQTEIIGAVITSTQSGNAIGNGDADISYSSEVLEEVAQTIPSSELKKTFASGTWREL